MTQSLALGEMMHRIKASIHWRISVAIAGTDTPQHREFGLVIDRKSVV